MRAPTVVLGGTLLLAACGGHRAVEIDPHQQAAGARWNATLATPAQLAGAMNLQGRGFWGSEEGNPSRSRAQVDIANAVPGGNHPWHVHVGQCGSNGPIIGPKTSARGGRRWEGDGDSRPAGRDADVGAVLHQRARLGEQLGHDHRLREPRASPAVTH
jgi:hypothetical protein